MQKKPKFKPEIIRVKLNPEQAVLSCTCYDGSGYIINSRGWKVASLFNRRICVSYRRVGFVWCYNPGSVIHRIEQNVHSSGQNQS